MTAIKGTKDVMTLPEVAERLGLHYQTVYDMAKEGKLPGYFVLYRNTYDHHRVDRREFERWYSARRRGKGAAIEMAE